MIGPITCQACGAAAQWAHLLPSLIPSNGFFFYGTLIDRDVLKAVLRRNIADTSRQPATIEGYRRVYRRDALYPILVPSKGGRVDGILVAGLNRLDAARLVDFEGADYELLKRTVITAQGSVTRALVFMPRAGVAASSQEWTPTVWRRRHRREYLRRVRSSRTPL